VTKATPRRPRTPPHDGHPVPPESRWSVAIHDTIPGVELWLNPLESHVYLSAFLDAAGTTFLPPYAGVRDAVGRQVDEVRAHDRRGQSPREDVAPQRLRTWKSVFESFGFLSVNDTSELELTSLGRAVRDLYATLNQHIDGANDQLARLAVDVLVRHRLRNPLEAAAYPQDSDLHPYRFVWRAMRDLDGRLHWEEMNRVLMKVAYEREVAGAIVHLRDSRRAAGGRWDDAWLASLGTPAVEDGPETRRRITPWFTQAGFGGLLITSEDDGEGFRTLRPEHLPLIEAALDRVIEVPAEALTTREAYLAYITADTVVADAPIGISDQADIDRIVEAADRYGSTKIICLSGIPGTGKSHLAKLAARQMVSGDPYCFEEVQFHESTGYEDFIEGYIPRPGGDGFDLKPKVFRVINERAKLDPKKRRFVLLIEELTRANVHAVLGELITYIEHRDREFTLALSQAKMAVSPNLVLLATMNPRDKSAILLDHAILRRLHQIPMEPSTTKLRALLSGKLADALLDSLAAWFDRYERTLPFGHAEFAYVRSEADLRDLWRGTLRYFLVDSMGGVRPAFSEVERDFPWR